MTNTHIPAQYATGLSRNNIENALTAAGYDLDHLRPADLGMLEDFHAMGRIATSQLVDLLDISPEHHVLDAGTGIGGTARFVADRCGCRVSAVDLTAEYCDTARWLNELVGLDDKISVRQADVTELPFDDGAFQVAFSQHVQMNVADKSRLYEEMRRVLAVGGSLAVWDITDGGLGDLVYPLPWADHPQRSHLVTPDRLRDTIESAGFAIEHWDDLSDQASALMRTVLASPGPLGLDAFVPDFAVKAANLTDALADGRLRAVRGIARAK
jgi:sarcosine/dimethylglycine N-methyltransferase